MKNRSAIKVNSNGPAVLALGGELKNTICFLEKDAAFLSPVFGDLKEPVNFSKFQKAAEVILKKNKPPIIAVDLNQNYLSTALGEELVKSNHRLKLVRIQHHEAHVAAVAAERDYRGRILGVAFDGAGLGTDGNIWGAEFFLGDLKNLKRVAHLKYAGEPGGDKGAQEPWRMAVSYLYQIFGDKFLNFDLALIKKIGHRQIEMVLKMIQSRINSPLTSSLGRLFDGVAAILGICYKNNFEGQAAQALEAIIRKGTGQYNFLLEKKENIFEIDFALVIKEILVDLKKKIEPGIIAYKFHEALARLIKKIAELASKKEKLAGIVFSGGVWQNKMLRNLTEGAFQKTDYHLFFPKKISAGDAGIALGQAVLARFKIN